MKYVNAKAVLPYHLVEETAGIHTGRIYLYPARETSTRLGRAKRLPQGTGRAERRNRGCLPAGGIPGGTGG